ncbi:MarR family winged helix-turn-helix transcriptional regulator [Notoacmeibacter ruber]|uniref:MarR family transcriptional regulator n=1 Tax=Notoacmeibacter ruber TaxID=2670375 RepID=A0A3L7JF62_9HYPH|nr:MarR family transcriptional regulator [Notoacmeibacter ruber]RLQ89120.1 MarR family transcriptional regulator [Notoacmeibacter ruber]
MSSATEINIFEIFDLVRLFRLRFEEEIAASDVVLTPAEARLLNVLAKHGPSRQADIAERLAIGAMSVTGLIDRLEKAGFVRRESDPDDRRAKRVQLTEASTPVLERIDQVKALLRGRAEADIDRHDYAIYAQVVHKMRANLLAQENVSISASVPNEENTDA